MKLKLLAFLFLGFCALATHADERKTIQPIEVRIGANGHTEYEDYAYPTPMQIVIITKQVVNDYQCIPNPGNPPSGNIRVYCDSGTGNLTCLTSTGSSCVSGGGSTTNALTMNNGGSGAASGTTFNGSSAITLSYNTIGAAPAASTPNVLYKTQSSSVLTNISPTTMLASASALSSYRFSWTISLTVVGIACYGNTTITLNAIFTDPNASSSTTQPVATVVIAAGGNGTVGFVADGAEDILAKSGTAIQYSTSAYTAGSGCTTNPTYQVSPTLVQNW